MAEYNELTVSVFTLTCFQYSHRQQKCRVKYCYTSVYLLRLPELLTGGLIGAAFNHFQLFLNTCTKRSSAPSEKQTVNWIYPACQLRMRPAGIAQELRKHIALQRDTEHFRRLKGVSRESSNILCGSSSQILVTGEANEEKLSLFGSPVVEWRDIQRRKRSADDDDGDEHGPNGR
jgi:hypothetical protein